MIDTYITSFKEWFDSRVLREKIFICFLSWAIMYALFSLTVYRPLDQEKMQLAEEIKKTNDQILNWQVQLKFIKEIPNTALYKEWYAKHQSYLSMKKYYQNLLGDPSNKSWENILRTVLSDYPNITIESINHSPESVYQTEEVGTSPETIYQQQLRVSIIGEFNDIVGYLTYLERTLPNIYWNTMNYEVKEYPLANVEMEFSVIYEKPTQ